MSMVERGPEVVLLLIEGIQPMPLLGAAKIGCLRHLQIPPRVTFRYPWSVASKKFERVFANGFEHPEPRVIRDRCALHHAVGGEAVEGVEVSACDLDHSL